MNLEFLETFCLVVEKGSFSAAARELGITQPAVSMQVANLEEFFDSSLLHRTGRGINLTKSGRHVLKLAQGVVKGVTDTKRIIHRDIDQVRGELHIVASSTPGEYVLPGLMADFLRTYPYVSFKVEVDNTRSAINRLLNGEVHMATAGRPVENELLSASLISQDEIILITSTQLTKDSAIIDKVEELQSLPYIRRLTGSGTRTTIDQALKKEKLTLEDMNVVAELGSTQAVIRAVAAGLGYAFVSKLAAEQVIASGQCVRIEVAGLNVFRDLYLVSRVSGIQTSVEKTFWEFICK